MLRDGYIIGWRHVLCDARSIGPLPFKRAEFDRAGRVVRTIQNYVAGGVLDGDTNVTTEVDYTADGNVATLTAKNPATHR